MEARLSDLVFTTGGFSSGSTLLFTVFRKAGEYYCLYEPLHERLLEHKFGNLRAYEHHYFVDEYFSEYRGFTALTHLHTAMAGTDLFLPAMAQAPDLYRYLSYLIGMSFGRRPKVLLKENRLTFRLGWIRAQFPAAKVVHVYRDCDAQWKSTVRRAQSFYGTQDVGQESVTFNGMGTAKTCEALAPVFPELAADRSKTGYERFAKLWELSLAENNRFAHVTVRYEELTRDFEATAREIWDALGCTADLAPLKQWVVTPENQRAIDQATGVQGRLRAAADRARFRYGRLRMRLDQLLRRPGE
jgi:Sulfotransferase family